MVLNLRVVIFLRNTALYSLSCTLQKLNRKAVNYKPINICFYFSFSLPKWDIEKVIPVTNSVELIHSADPQSLPLVINIFTHVRPSIPTFQTHAKQNHFQVRIVNTGGIVGLAEGIIDDTCLVLDIFTFFCCPIQR